MSEPKAPVVLSLVGPGRGGSTVIGRILAAQLGAPFPGETRSMWDWTDFQGGPLCERSCGCGRLICECPFWEQVIAEVPSLLDRQFVAEAERIHAGTISAMGMPLYLLSAQKWLRSLRLPPGYLPELRRLLSVIAEKHGSSVIVDTSKSPRYVTLLRAAGVDVRVLQVLRDPRAVVYGWSRRREVTVGKSGRALPNLSTPMQSLTWDGTIVQSWLRCRVEATAWHTVRYEDFMNDPDEAMRRSLTALGFQTTAEQFLVRREDGWYADLPVQHSMQGNENRVQTGEVPLRIDARWRTEMGSRDRFVTSALTWPLAALYGYWLW